MVKNLPASARDAGDLILIPGSGRSVGARNGNPLQYSGPENPTDRGAWWATVHGIVKSQTRLSTHALPLGIHGWRSSDPLHSVDSINRAPTMCEALHEAPGQGQLKH